MKWLFNWKYRYIKRKISGIKKMVLDFEFKRYKAQELREDVRQEYSNHKSQLESLEAEIKKQKETPTMEQGEIARLDDKKVLLERDIENFKKQMDQIDMEVQGAKPTNENPEGVVGVNEQLEALRELEIMYRDYLKKV